MQRPNRREQGNAWTMTLAAVLVFAAGLGLGALTRLQWAASSRSTTTQVLIAALLVAVAAYAAFSVRRYRRLAKKAPAATIAAGLSYIADLQAKTKVPPKTSAPPVATTAPPPSPEPPEQGRS